MESYSLWGLIEPFCCAHQRVPFSLFGSIPFCAQVTACLPTHQWWDIFPVFWLLWMKPLYTSAHRPLCEPRCSPHLGISLEVGLLSHVVSTHLTLKETARLLAVAFCIPTSNEWESPLLHILPALGLVRFFFYVF